MAVDDLYKPKREEPDQCLLPMRMYGIMTTINYDDIPNSQTAEAIVQGRNILDAGTGQFESPEELFNALGI